MPERTQVDKCTGIERQQNVILPFSVYSLNEAARLLHVRPEKVREFDAAGRLPRLRHTRTFLVWGEDLIAFARSVSRVRGDAP